MSWAFIALTITGVGAITSAEAASDARKDAQEAAAKEEAEAKKREKKEADIAKQSAMALKKRRGATSGRAKPRSDVLTSPLGLAGSRLAGVPKTLIGR